MSKSGNYLTYIVLLLAIIAWGSFGYVVYSIGGLESGRLADSQAIAQREQQSMQASYLHSLVISSGEARSHLDSLAQVDPASLADIVAAAGSAAGISMTISNASAQSAPSIDGKTTVQIFSLLCSSHGSFAAVLRAAQLLETLPVPSSIQKIEFDYVAKSGPGAGGGANAAGEWQMNAQLQVISASNAS